MKMKRMWVAIVVVCQIMISCNEDDGYFPCIYGKGTIGSEERTIDQFTEIDYRLSGKVEIVKGNVYRVSIQGYENHIPMIRTLVADKKLIIDSDRCLKNDDFNVKITLPDLKSLRASGSTDLVVKDSFEGDSLSFDLSGSGSITALAIDYQYINTKLSGSGQITLTGNVVKLWNNVSGSGAIKAFNLNAQEVDAHVSGSGRIESTVLQKLDAQISGSGKIQYKGSPSIINSTISGSGKVEHVN